MDRHDDFWRFAAGLAALVGLALIGLFLVRVAFGEEVRLGCDKPSEPDIDKLMVWEARAPEWTWGWVATVPYAGMAKDAERTTATIQTRPGEQIKWRAKWIDTAGNASGYSNETVAVKVWPAAPGTPQGVEVEIGTGVTTATAGVGAGTRTNTDKHGRERTGKQEVGR